MLLFFVGLLALRRDHVGIRFAIEMHECRTGFPVHLLAKRDLYRDAERIQKAAVTPFVIYVDAKFGDGWRPSEANGFIGERLASDLRSLLDWVDVENTKQHG